MSAQFIYTMHKVGRYYPPDRQILENITLAFYPGAKIGVLGGNGAGKSSLLKIMGGLDDGFSGDARLTPGFTVGYLEQEPQLDPSKDVRGNVMDGAGTTVQLLARYEEVLAGWADPDADYEKLGASMDASIHVLRKYLRGRFRGVGGIGAHRHERVECLGHTAGLLREPGGGAESRDGEEPS